jgi:metal-dependent amidase/aminoacylase/carboxypeptidase family protein
MPIRNRFAELLPEITEWRQHLHRNPEILYEVHQTAAFVAEKLRDFGVDEIVEGIGQTGVVGVIRGKGAGTRTIGLRADMDALPIHEETGLDYASEVPGKMHACGHDGHTSMLLGAAKYLSETRNFDGTVVVIFQPAEEGGAGAKAMIDDGLVDRFGIDEFYGMHNAPGVPLGHIETRPGPLQASADEFEIVVTGMGGHAAEPHQGHRHNARRRADRGDAAFDRLAQCRPAAWRRADRGHVRDGFERVQHHPRNGAHARHGALSGPRGSREDGGPRAPRRGGYRQCLRRQGRAELGYGYPVTVNHEDATVWAVEAARAVANDVGHDANPIMPSEDFSYMLNERPGTYLFLGNGDSAMCHHPKYNFNDEAIPYGCSFFAEIVERRMPAR